MNKFKYVGKPTRERKINLKHKYFKNKSVNEVMLNLEKQDKLNINKSYAFYFL